MKITKRDLFKIIRESMLEEDSSYLDMPDMGGKSVKFTFPHPGRNKFVGNLYDIVYYVESPKFKRVTKKIHKIYETAPDEIYDIINKSKKDEYSPQKHSKYLKDLLTNLNPIISLSDFDKNVSSDQDYLKFKRSIEDLRKYLVSIDEVVG